MSSGNDEGIKSRIRNSLHVIHTYDWLLDLYVLDFFVENHWEKLPKSWRDCFNSMDPSDIGYILTGTHRSSYMLPLSFIALLKVVNLLNIPREETQSIENSSNKITYMHPKLKNIFIKHIKFKKRHEISKMSNFVHNLATELNCRAILDFGSGLGHLIRILAYNYEMVTAGIECQSELISQARKLDHELQYTLRKHLPQEYVSELCKPFHINIQLSCVKQLQDLKLPDNMNNYGLTGLHPCGDLGPLLLRHFVNSAHVKFICLIGCCYMKVSCKPDSNSHESGYPMSSYVQSLKRYHLSYNSREIACHAIELYCERLKSGKYDDLKVHAYRAALEVLLVAADPNLRHTQVGNVKHVSNLSFEEYCSVALARTGIKCSKTGVAATGEAALNYWRRVVVLYSLRLALAPLVETVILLDRLLYLRENGFHCTIHPLFDPKISPRNYVLTARRL